MASARVITRRLAKLAKKTSWEEEEEEKGEDPGWEVATACFCEVSKSGLAKGVCPLAPGQRKEQRQPFEHSCRDFFGEVFCVSWGSWEGKRPGPLLAAVFPLSRPWNGLFPTLQYL